MIVEGFKQIRQKVRQHLAPQTEISKRIKERYTAFWPKGFGKNIGALSQIATSANRNEWGTETHWQRLLENKYNARGFASKLGCKVPDLYWKADSPATVPFEQLPTAYVIKPTIGYSSNNVFLMRHRVNLLENCAYTEQEIKTKLIEAATNRTDTEFLCEEFLQDEKGSYRVPDDYKFFMFNGEVACIQLINRFGALQAGMRGTVTCFDEHWKVMPHITKSAFLEGKYQAPPACLDEMINYAKTLSKAYRIFVRIDFYATQKGAVFGEFCPTPLRGNGFTAFGNELLIKMWDKNCIGLV